MGNEHSGVKDGQSGDVDHPEAFQGSVAAPSEAEIVETWEDRFFPFVGFEPEIATATAIQSNNPQAKREFPADDMVRVPAGEVKVGDPLLPGARPVHTVFVEAFYIDRYEVTNARYQEFIRRTNHRAPCA